MTYRPTESESDAITVVGVVIVGVAVAVDITEIIAVARIRRTLPPVVSRQGNNAGLDPVIQEDFYIGRDLSA